MSGMRKEANFFRQKVNSFLSILLIGSMCLWTTVYYFIHKAEIVTNDYTQERNQLLIN